MARCAMAGVDSVWSGIKVGFIAWLAGSFVQVATPHIWVRIDLNVTIAHALGYLARFLIAGIAAGFALPLVLRALIAGVAADAKTPANSSGSAIRVRCTCLF